MACAISTPTHSLQRILEQHLESQGSSMNLFLERVDEVSSAARVPIYSDAAGILEIDLTRVRDVLVKAQADDGGTFRDRAGLHLLARPGRAVKKRDVIASVRGLAGGPLNELAAAFVTVEGPPRDIVAMEIVNA
jgi:thymidine phosphorylase